MDLRQVGITHLRTSRKQMGTSSISTQPRNFGFRKGKVREARIMAKFVTADAPTPITHGLGFVPTSWQAMPLGSGLMGVVAPGVVYADTPLKADKNVIVLKCSVAGAAEIIVR